MLWLPFRVNTSGTGQWMATPPRLTEPRQENSGGIPVSPGARQ